MSEREQRQFGVRIAAYRKRRGLTQAALAKKAELSWGYLARLEIGRHDPSLTTLRKLAKALKVTLPELLP